MNLYQVAMKISIKGRTVLKAGQKKAKPIS